MPATAMPASAPACNDPATLMARQHGRSHGEDGVTMQRLAEEEARQQRR